ncbi:hypothetical protein CJP74_02265 [Psittacicella melopsittaci]|uniref:GHMP kinase N-terminal domain-containing protein n=1 Tax=Psittacicella melopsittaci TaxID=2028576 RepID=A0A3A1Y4P9_9GAMM|nr:hypothetical protein [Psittacicella melopsittaci]RIY33272.1 hypothetical protein CJP74_02265 [Psittacicella melopsittaci]
MKESYVLNSPAKINLFLNVDAKLNTGYHAISTYFKILPQIADYLIVTWEQVADPQDMPSDPLEAGRIFLNNLEIHGFEGIVAKEGNLIYKSLAHLAMSTELLSTASAEQIKNFASYKLVVKVDKRVPVQGGLGGGSSNGAVILQTVAKKFFPLLTPSNLIAIAQRVGADCAVFVHGKSSLAYRIGDLFFTPQAEEFYQVFSTLYHYLEGIKEIDLTDPLSFYDYGSRELKVYPNIAYLQELVLVLVDLAQQLIDAVNKNPNIIPNQALDFISLARHIEHKYHAWLNGYFLVFTSDYKVDTGNAFKSLGNLPQLQMEENPRKFKQTFLQSWKNTLKQLELDPEAPQHSLNSFANNFFANSPLLDDLKHKFNGNLQLTGTGATCFVYVPRLETILNWHLRKFKEFCKENPLAAQFNLQMHKIDLVNSNLEIWSA